MDITITFTTSELDQSIEALLTHKATKAGKTVESYLEDWVKEWAKGQIMGYYQDKMRDLTYDQLKAIFGSIV